MPTHKLSQVLSIAIVMMMSFKDSRMNLKSFAEELNAPARDKPKCEAIANNTSDEIKDLIKGELC